MYYIRRTLLYCGAHSEPYTIDVLAREVICGPQRVRLRGLLSSGEHNSRAWLLIGCSCSMQRVCCRRLGGCRDRRTLLRVAARSAVPSRYCTGRRAGSAWSCMPARSANLPHGSHCLTCRRQPSFQKANTEHYGYSCDNARTGCSCSVMISLSTVASVACSAKVVGAAHYSTGSYCTETRPTTTRPVTHNHRYNGPETCSIAMRYDKRYDT